MMKAAAQARDAVSFGPFTLAASERLLTRDGVPVELGARALDVLIALVSHPNEVVSKKDLLAQVWPDVTVEESSLRFHIASLRKALGDGKDGARYIATLAGRGYCFVAPVSRPVSRDSADVTPDNAGMAAAGSAPPINLPARLARMVGRDDDVLRVSTQLTATRFVTIAGSGGVGKTTTAIAVGHHLAEAFAGAVLFVDLGMLSDPGLVAATIAAMLGLSVQSDDATPSLIAWLQERRILLILDTCEHLIEAAADLASRIFAAAPQVYILATSRELLQVEGEHVYRLDPLSCPPDEPGLTAACAGTFPATQLFVERAMASGARFDFSDADAAIIAGICRKLDGVALAIELAARRVEAYGLQQTAALLDQRLTLLWAGPRTAPPRQKTLHATLDWSYGLLSEPERTVLRRLAAFIGPFTLDAALEVATTAGIDHACVFATIDSLVAKSMVATCPVGAMMRYRLLDTTRAYILDIDVDDAERAGLAARHAAYYRRWLERAAIEWPTLSTVEQRAIHLAGLNNVRTALEWCFGAGGNAEIGVGLAAAAAPVFLAMSLLPECHRWSEQAILALDEAARGGSEEMQLQAARGVSVMFTCGGRDAARDALNRSFAIAEEHGDAAAQLRLLGPLNMFHLRTGDFRAALQCAQRCSVIASAADDPAAVAMAHAILGTSLHHCGDLGGARPELEAALERGPRFQRTTAIYLGFEGRNLAGGILARNLWLQGHPRAAVERARQTISEAAAMDHSVTLAIALIWGISVFLWTGDLDSAERHIEWLISHAESHSLAPYLLIGQGFKGEVVIRHGDAKGGTTMLQDCLDKLHAAPYEFLTTLLTIACVRGLAGMARFEEGVELIDETIGFVRKNGDLCYMPELMRVKGGLLLSGPEPDREGAEACFAESLELSRHQGACAWELRAGVDLAALWAAQGQAGQARSLLRPIFEQFTDGLVTADLKEAERLLASLTKARP